MVSDFIGWELCAVAAWLDGMAMRIVNRQTAINRKRLVKQALIQAPIGLVILNIKPDVLSHNFANLQIAKHQYVMDEDLSWLVPRCEGDIITRTGLTN